ncbi:MAG: Re/Si-specific NAD(P)(+) transhydrogenase subunit alpha [Candidatus Limnocylindria bacterium]
MKIAVPRETAPGETRVALSPPAVTALIADGVEVVVQSGAGDASFISDEAFREAGATIVPDAAAVYGDADVVVRVGRPTDEETGMMRSGAILIGTLGTLSNPELARRLAETGVTAISMDSIPRISRAQSMDTLSSQATVGGYKAVLLAAERLPKFMPLLTTAAGTVRPARGIVMGAGVAGLMAIGTARRLGAVVEATDVRPVVKEQVESLGGIFIEVEMTDEEKASAETAGGYAREMSDDYKARQAALIAERVKEADFVITTALIPGRPAPRLVTDAMVASMKPGSVIVDMAAEMGGNVEGTEAGKEVVKHGVTIIGLTNLPATMPGSATAMYAKNMQTLLQHLIKDGAINLDFTDEITRGATITHGGKVVNEATAKALGIEVSDPTPAAPAAPAAPAGGAA